MASKRRIRRKSCEGKLRHETENGAWIASKETKGNVRPYKCKFCSGWHVGHTPRKVKQAIAASKREKGKI